MPQGTLACGKANSRIIFETCQLQNFSDSALVAIGKTVTFGTDCFSASEGERNGDRDLHGFGWLSHKFPVVCEKPTDRFTNQDQTQFVIPN